MTNVFDFLVKSLLTFSLFTIISCATDIQNTPKNQPSHSAFVAKQNNLIIKQKGDIHQRHSPFSTFKVALALMGFDAGILHSKESPKWSFDPSYEKNFQSWYRRESGAKYGWFQDHTPETFMKKSVVWYSHQITQRLGFEKFQNYITTLQYGNQDVSGTPGMNDGLLNAWLGTSLQISAFEQAEFIEKLISCQLNVSREAQEKTKEIMDREEDWNGWKLYGKTGGGSTGWFVGWIEKDNQQIIFAQYLDLEDSDLDLTNIPSEGPVGLKAKELIKRELRDQINGE